MSQVVLDASITLSWCFPEEKTPLSLRVLERLKAGDEALVPFFWSLEVLNTLLIGERRGRISAEQTLAFLAHLEALQPTFDHASFEEVNGPIQEICRDHAITPYDAVYLELAMRADCPLATQDQAQKAVAAVLKVRCL